jgi:hypothetical protein
VCEYITAGGRNVGWPMNRWRDQHSLRWDKPAMPYTRTLRLMVSRIINHFCCQHFVQTCYRICISLWLFLVAPFLPTYCRCRVLLLHLATHHYTHTHILYDSSGPVIGTSQTPVSAQHTTITRDRHPCSRRDWNPQFLQASGHWDRLWFFAFVLVKNVDVLFLFTIFLH